MADPKQKLYVGYLPLPKHLGKTVRGMLLGWLVLMLGIGGLLAWNQQDPGPGKWDIDNTVEIQGRLEVHPYPILYLDPESPGERSKAILLVSQFKFGPTERATPLMGQHTLAKGNFISYGERSMFELIDGPEALTVAAGNVAMPGEESLGQHELVGEIVDSKCFLGAMKPAFGKTHRACAVRCISGGITPLFVTRDTEGEPTFYVLESAQGQIANEAVLPYIAEPIKLVGKVSLRGDLLHFAANLEDIQRQ